MNIDTQIYGGFACVSQLSDTWLVNNEQCVINGVGEAGSISLLPSSPFSFERLLSGEDWSRWDNFPTVQSGYRIQTLEMNANTNGETMNTDDLMVQFQEMGDRGEPVEFIDSLLGANPSLSLSGMPTQEELVMFEQWLYASSGEEPQVSSRDNLFSNIEDMTYEELLALAEGLGDVCCGIDAETMDENLNRRKYEDCDAEDETCVICLDELRRENEVSRLRCGHVFHFLCIKQWLTAKNSCPLCKKRVLACHCQQRASSLPCL